MHFASPPINRTLEGDFDEVLTDATPEDPSPPPNPTSAPHHQCQQKQWKEHEEELKQTLLKDKLTLVTEGWQRGFLGLGGVPASFSKWCRCKTTNLVTHPAVNVCNPCKNTQKTPRQKSAEIWSMYFPQEYQPAIMTQASLCVYVIDQHIIHRSDFESKSSESEPYFGQRSWTSKDDLHPKITGTMPSSGPWACGGGLPLYPRGCYTLLETFGHDQEVRSIGTIRDTTSSMMQHTHVWWFWWGLEALSSRPCFGVFDGG
jgi:hypothetical protein